MQISLTHILLSIELSFLFVLAWRCNRFSPVEENMGSVYVYLLWVSTYGILTGILGARGVYTSEELLKFLPGLWLQLITVASIVLPVVLFDSVRNGIRRMVDTTPWHWFAYFHGLRITALGTTYKTMVGEFPASFGILVGLPDLLFGISAFWMAGKVKRGEISQKGFLIWNLVGFFAIVPAAPIVLLLGLPGPLQVFTGLPDARAVVTYPMSIASIMGVPLFVLINLGVAWRLWEWSRGGDVSRQSFMDQKI